MAKGNTDCHIPNDKYREGWERTFGKQDIAAMNATTNEFLERHPNCFDVLRHSKAVTEKMLGVKSLKPGISETCKKKS